MSVIRPAITAGPIERHLKAEIVDESNVEETWAAALLDSVIAAPARSRRTRTVRMFFGCIVGDTGRLGNRPADALTTNDANTSGRG